MVRQLKKIRGTGLLPPMQGLRQKESFTLRWDDALILKQNFLLTLPAVIAN